MSQSYPQAKYQSLTRRRGSASAHDPLALHPDQPVLGDRQAMSRLTIVRVNPEDTVSLYGAPEGSPDSSPRSARMSLTPPHSPIMRANTGPRRGSGAGGSPRLSFASSSFAHEPGSGSPPRSPKELRRRHSGSGTHVVRHAALTPQQVVDLAKSSVRPPPKLQRHPSAPALLGRGRDAPATPSITPATFIPIPASQLLPFIDRPGEVTTFISTPPTSRLMALLEQAFPIHLRIRSGHSQPPPYTISRAQSFADELAAALRVYAAEPRAEFNDPENWSYATLIEWMCTIPRTIADDAEWVRRLRTCVMAHSEQICVTLLSALGVPMEGVDEVLQPKDKPLHQNNSTPTIESPTALRPGSDTPTADHPHRSVVTTPPTILEDTLGENEDAFRLSISAILSAPPEPVEQTRAWSDSGSSSSSRGRGRVMEAIGESEDEEREADNEEEQELEIRRGREPRSGVETARSGSPAVGAVRAGRVVAADSSGTDSDGELDEDFPDLFGLSFATVPRGTGGADVLPSLRPEGAFPVPITTSKPPKGGARVAHVLSGAPGHAGYTWRPGGPLFARSFGGDESASEDEKVPPLLPRAIFDIKRPSLRQRSRSRDARKAVVLVVPPNTPINGLVELADAELLPFETLTVS